MAGILLGLLVAPLLAVYVLVVLLVLDMDSSYGQYALLIPVAYILGSVPWGYLITLAVRGVDIRQYGSGKVGYSNVLRTTGGAFAVLALALDLSKGLLAVFLARAVADTDAAQVATGLVALAGHNWSLFLGFRGGRGIATGVGGLIVMEPIAAAVAMATFTPITLLTRYLSLGSTVSVVVAFLTVLVMVIIDRSTAAYLVYTGIGGAMIIWQHRDNIRRLLKGTERRLGQPSERMSGTSSSEIGSR